MAQDCHHLLTKANLLKNPNGSENMNHWEVQNGGDGWAVEDMPGPGPFHHDTPKYFVSSFALCLKKQVINLLDHFSAGQLDNEPEVRVEDWYCCRTDCGAIYQITVCLLDGNHQNISRFEPKVMFLTPETNSTWAKVAHTFSNYGPGLRYISFEHGGQDTKFWKGWYGVRVTGSSVKIKA